MARWALALLMLIPLLSGCLGGEDDPDPTGDTPSETTGTGPSASTPPTGKAPARPGQAAPAPVLIANPNVRVDDLPLPIDVTKGAKARVPGGGTTMLLIQSDTEFRFDNALREGGAADTFWWMLLYKRNETEVEQGPACGPTPGGFRFWSNHFTTEVNWRNIPAGEYLLYVHNVDGTAIKMGFQGANPNDAEDTPHFRWRNHTSEVVTFDVTPSPDYVNHASIYGVEVPGAGPALVFTRFSISHQARAVLFGYQASSTLSSSDGTQCSQATAVETYGFEGAAARTLYAYGQVAPDSGPLTWDMTYTANVTYSVQHTAKAVVVQFDDVRAYRPYWVP